MSKELIKVQVSSPRESENSIGVLVNLRFDENPNYEYLISLLQTCNKI